MRPLFTRIVAMADEDAPEHDRLTEEQFCPPHDFTAAWATPVNPTNNDDTVPALYCGACGDIRPFKLPQ